MTKISNRTWLVLGFALSVLSVATNLLVVSGINERVRSVDSEIAKLETSIRTQTADIDRADLKFDLFRILHHMSKLSTGEPHQEAGQDALRFLQDYLKGYYSAVNDVSETELLRSETAKVAAMIPIIDKIHEAERLRKEGKTTEAQRVSDEADGMFAAYSPADELGRNIDKLTEFAKDPALAERKTLDVTGVMAPHFRDLVQRYLTNYDANNAKLAELRAKREDLTQWSSRATYAAISLQLFALFFFFAKDLVKEGKVEK
ncbi:MAG: hypothetical protein QM785_08665 [Pyrinomonadaceae bacterium]